MDDYFKKAADRLPKNVYIVYTDGLVDSLRAADMLKTICQSSTNGEDTNVYFVDSLNTVYLDTECELYDYALNCHGYTHRDYKKAGHIFQDYLGEKYHLESTCLTSKYTGGSQHALFQLFEQEDADNVVVLAASGLIDYAKQEIYLSRSGPNGMKKHVQYEEVPNDVPNYSTENIVSRCPRQEQYNRQL